MTTSLINIKNLSINYGDCSIINNLSFDINEGDFLCIVGPNGSGKSTLIKAIIGEVKYSSGSIIFSPSIKQNAIGYLPQNNKINESFPATVTEIIATGCLNRHHFMNKEMKQKITQTIKTLHIASIKDKEFSELSGGQRQKVLLARALCATSKLLILDEASNNLDYNSKISFYKMLKKLNETDNLTIVMVTHDLDHNNLLGNKILSLDRDQPFFGSTKEYIRRIHAH